MKKQIRQARIVHQCYKCDELIYPKDKYLEICGETNTYFWTIRLCRLCKDKRFNYHNYPETSI